MGEIKIIPSGQEREFPVQPEEISYDEFCRKPQKETNYYFQTTSPVKFWRVPLYAWIHRQNRIRGEQESYISELEDKLESKDQEIAQLKEEMEILKSSPEQSEIAQQLVRAKKLVEKSNARNEKQGVRINEANARADNFRRLLYEKNFEYTKLKEENDGLRKERAILLKRCSDQTVRLVDQRLELELQKLGEGD